ncbi:PEGA domain-containing protein [Sorangium sp. So ce394]|uniref:PEGA domain-containing protein n=1 Tax=Sorangium sp. So ce394 TaxID=3133310 RepID=UPI003F5C0DDE
MSVAGVGNAASADEPYADPDVRAASMTAGLLRRARQAQAAGRQVAAAATYERALEAAQGAWTTDAERATIAGELGLVELSLGRHRDAASHLAQCLQHRGVISGWLRDQVDDGLQRAAKRVATVYVTTNPPGAEVLIDEQALYPPEPVHEVFVEPGQHTARARLEGHEEAVSSFFAEAGLTHPVALKLRRLPERVARASEAAPAAPLPAAPAGAPAGSTFPLTELRIGGVALTTATVAAGTVFLLRSGVLRDDLAAQEAALRGGGGDPSACGGADAPLACAELRDTAEERDLFRELGVGTLVAGGVFAAVTVAAFLTDLSYLAREPARQGVRVVPVMTAERAGVFLQGTW